MAHRIFSFNYHIKESDLDTFGHVNNAQYMRFFEAARWELITGSGFGLSVIHETKKGPVVLEANIKFKKELKNREEVVILTQPQNLEAGRFMILRQWIEKENGDISAEAIFKIGFFDTAARKLIAPEKKWLEACGFDINELALN